MAANMYDQAALALFINTYAPINFGELFRISAAQKEDMDRAALQFGAQLLKFGEFRSLSGVDTDKYYDLTVGRNDFLDAINQMVSNPEWMKDAANRGSLQSLINSVDYSTLSKLKLNAENFDKRAQVIALMKAAGRYNPNWDDINMTQWDTALQGIMADLAPIEYMSANQLSNAYFDNLKPSTMSSIVKDGVKYMRLGIEYDTLKDIAKARFNDLVATPQGEKYYEQALRANNGNADAAREAFTSMIADSQRDRIMVNEQVDPYWLATARRGAGSSTETISPQPTRLDFLNDTFSKAISKNLSSRYGADYNAYLTKKIGSSTGSDRKRYEEQKQNIDNLTSQYLELALQASAAQQAYQLTGNTQDFIKATVATNQAAAILNQVYGIASKNMATEEFENTAKFSPNNLKSKNYSHEGYLRGVKSALDVISAPASLMERDDMLTGVGGKFDEVVDANGTKKNVYTFNTTSGFVLPETVFQLVTETEPRTVKKGAGLFRDDAFPLRELIESGYINDVQFLPENRMTKIGGSFALQGKMRIPKDVAEKQLGTGVWSDKGLTGGATDPLVAWFGVLSTRTAIKDLFGGRDVEELIGKDGKTYYEIDSYRLIPEEDVASETWQRTNQRWLGGNPAGIGGASQAKDTYMDSARQLGQ